MSTRGHKSPVRLRRRWFEVLESRLPLTSAPVTQQDSYLGIEDTPVEIKAEYGLLANDHDPDGNPFASFVAVAPLHGTVRIEIDGGFRYTPFQDFFGDDAFYYRAFNGSAFSATTKVSISLLPVDDLPRAIDDSYVFNQGAELAQPPATGVLANDPNSDGDPLFAELVESPLVGSLQLEFDGSFSYQVPPGFIGTASFRYRVSDPFNTSTPATVSILVNDVPQGAEDHFTATEDMDLVVAQSHGLLANDTDSFGQALVAQLVNGPQHGTLELLANGGFHYRSDADYSGADSFTYWAFDGFASSTPTTVSLNIQAVNDPPTAQGDSFAVGEDRTLEVAGYGVLENDSDPEGDFVTSALLSGPQHGALSLFPNGQFHYLPVSDFFGTDQFTYVPMAAGIAGQPATVSITVLPQDDPPLVVNDSYQTSQGVSLVVSAAQGLLKNDSDVDQEALLATITELPAHGTLTLDSNGAFTYTPNPGFTGVDRFRYQASNGTRGPDFYSIDSDRDELVLVQSLTGTTTLVGSIGFDTQNPDLAYLNGKLYATTQIAQNWAVLEIDPATGAYARQIPLTYQGADVTQANALAAVNGELVVYFGAPGIAYRALGTINRNTGAITFLESFTSNTGELAGLTGGPGGTVYAINSTYTGYAPPIRQVGVASIYPGQISGGGLANLAAFPNDGTFTDASATTIYAIDSDTAPALVLLHTLTFGSGLQLTNSILVDRGRLNGLAYAPDRQFDSGVVTVGVGVPVVPDPVIGPSSARRDTPALSFAGGARRPNVPSVPLNATSDGYQTPTDSTLIATGRGVLNNDGGTNAGALLVDRPAHGSVRLNEDGSFVYEPDRGFVGTDTFSYRVSEGLIGHDLFTIDSSTDTLYRVNTATGAIQSIGPIGLDMQDSDLAYLNGALYAATTAAGGPLLVKINPTTGHFTGQVFLKYEGAFLTSNPSISAVGNEMFAYFAAPGIAHRAIGRIDLTTGAITALLSIPPTIVSHEGLGTDPNGVLVAIDAISYSGNQKQVVVDALWPIGAPRVYPFDIVAPIVPNDIAFTPNSTRLGYAIDATYAQLRLMNLEFGVQWVGSVALPNTALNFSGLAYAPDLQTNRAVVSILVGAPAKIGDANRDGSVGSADYAIWAAQFGKVGLDLSADFDNNGQVGLADYALWAANFTQSPAPAAVQGTPAILPTSSPAKQLRNRSSDSSLLQVHHSISQLRSTAPSEKFARAVDRVFGTCASRLRGSTRD